MYECDRCGVVLRNENVADAFRENMDEMENLFEMVGIDKWEEGIRRGIVKKLECHRCEGGILS